MAKTFSTTLDLFLSLIISWLKELWNIKLDSLVLLEP